jgi:hypothetical protein
VVVVVSRIGEEHVLDPGAGRDRLFVERSNPSSLAGSRERWARRSIEGLGRVRGHLIGKVRRSFLDGRGQALLGDTRDVRLRVAVGRERVSERAYAD